MILQLFKYNKKIGCREILQKNKKTTFEMGKNLIIFSFVRQVIYKAVNCQNNK